MAKANKPLSSSTQMTSSAGRFYQEGLNMVPAGQAGAPVGRIESLGAAFDIGNLDSSSNSFTDIVASTALNLNENIPLMSPEELNETFDTDIFKIKMTKQGAQLFHDRARQRKLYEEVLAKGPQDFAQTGLNFTGSIAANLADPLDLTADVLVGMGIGALAKSTKIGAKLFSTWGSRHAPLRRQFAEGATEGFLGNLAVEPVLQAASSLEGRDRTFQETATELFAGALAFPAVKVGGRYAFSRGFEFFDGLDTRTVGTTYRSAIAQFKETGRIDNSPVFRELIANTSEFRIPENKGALWGKHIDYQFNKRSSVSSTDSFFISSRNHAVDINKIESGKFSDFYGGVIDATDSPFVANGASARISDGKQGSVLEVRFTDDAKIFDIDQRVSDLDETTRQAVLDSYRESVEVDLKDRDLTVKQVIDDLHDGIVNSRYKEDVVDSFNKKFSEKTGVSGYIHESNRLGGFNHNPHNVAVVLDSSKVQPVSKQSSDFDYTGRLSTDEMKSAVLKSLNPEKPTIFEDRDPVEVKQEIEEFRRELQDFDEEATAASLEAQRKSGVVDEKVAKTYNDLIEEENIRTEAYDVYVSCILGGAV